MTPILDSNATDSPIQVGLRAFGRVHFGLWEISESAPDCFGGIGLMIQHSAVTLHAELASQTKNSPFEIQADDYWRPRIQSVLDRWLQTDTELPISGIRIEQSPPPHRGLGSGTQMACAIATLLQIDPKALSQLPQNSMAPYVPITSLLQRPTNPTRECNIEDYMSMLANLGQRGQRSNIGLHGFLEGGFIIDHGMQNNPDGSYTLPRRTSRLAFPPWPVIVIHDENSQGDSGKSEKEMFDRCSSAPNRNRHEMISLVEMEISPAIANQNWARFDLAIGQYGRLAGEVFAPAQGGVYRTERIAHTIETVKQLGITGATQSSWGPTVVAIAKDFEHANWCLERLQERLPHLAIEVLHAANHSAQAWVL